LLPFACLLPALLSAQNPARPAQAQAAPAAKAAEPAAPRRPLKSDGNGFTLPEGEVTIDELIDGAAKYLGRNLLYSSQELAAGGNSVSWTFQKQLTVDALGCEEVLYGLLYQKGFAVLPIDVDKQIYEVVFMGGQRGREVVNRAPWRTPEEILKRPGFKEMVVTSLPLQHINATVATNALRPFFSNAAGPQGGSSLALGNVGNNSAILLMGFRDQVAAAIRMLRECDTPPKEMPVDAATALAELQSQVKQLQAQVAELKKPAEKK